MNKHLLAAVLALPWFCLLGWVLFLVIANHNAKEIILPITGYDPKDLFAGRYIAYQIDWDKADCSQFPEGICPKESFCKKARWGSECRFYVPEKKAYQLDRVFRDRNQNDLKFEVLYLYRKGIKPTAKEIIINGTPWREYLKQHPITHGRHILSGPRLSGNI